MADYKAYFDPARVERYDIMSLTAPRDGFPGDYWRFTEDSLRLLLAPFAELSISIHGNPVAAFCAANRIAAEDASRGDLDWTDPRFPLHVNVYARKQDGPRVGCGPFARRPEVLCSKRLVTTPRGLVRSSLEVVIMGIMNIAGAVLLAFRRDFDYPGGHLHVPEEVFTALSRLARSTPGSDETPSLAPAVREAAALSGAEVAVLRLPDGPTDFLEVRHPARATWPPARLLQRWHAEIIQRKRPIELASRDRPLRQPIRHGLILPVLAGSGAFGALGLFSSAPVVAPDRYLAALLAIQASVGRVEQARIRRHTEASTTSEVRDRVAREIHDGPLQLLSGIMLHLRLVRAGGRRGSTKTLTGLEGELEQAIRQMRALIRNLRVAHPEATLGERVKEALSRLERTRGLTCSLRWRAPDNVLDEAIADEVFQVINEALANVYRHSSAKHVEVHGRVRGDAFEVTVRDDGVGFDVARALRTDARRLSFGLMTMQERVARLGGTLVLRSQSGRGTRVLIALPIRRVEARKGA